MVAYTRQTSALLGTADKLLDAASYGVRWTASPRPLTPGLSGHPARLRPAALADPLTLRLIFRSEIGHESVARQSLSLRPDPGKRQLWKSLSRRIFCLPSVRPYRGCRGQPPLQRRRGLPP